MTITLKVKQEKLDDLLSQLKGQMGFYFQDYTDKGLTMMGEKMNVYLDRYPHALLPSSERTIHILAKPFVL